MNFRKNNVLPDLFLSCTTQQVSEEAQELGKERTTPFSLGTNLIFLRLSKKKKKNVFILCYLSLLVLSSITFSFLRRLSSVTWGHLVYVFKYIFSVFK